MAEIVFIDGQMIGDADQMMAFTDNPNPDAVQGKYEALSAVLGRSFPRHTQSFSEEDGNLVITWSSAH